MNKAYQPQQNSQPTQDSSLSQNVTTATPQPPLVSKRELLHRMQTQLTNYNQFIIESLKQAYNQKFLECSTKGGSHQQITFCQNALNARLNQAQIIVTGEDQQQLLQFRDCSRQAKQPEDMYVCFNTMMMQKEEQLKQATGLVLEEVKKEEVNKK